MMSRAAPLLFALLAAIGGCANMKPGMGFDDVQRDVADRAGMKLHWNTGSESDAETTAAVNALLERNLTADAAVQIALLNNRTLQAVYEDLNLAQADLVQAGLLRNPIFRGEVRFATSGGGTGVVLDVAQDFVSLFWLPLRKGLAGAAFEAGKLRVTGAVLDHAGQTRAAFYVLQAAEQTREMRASVVQGTEASYELAKRLRAAGNIRELDLANERALYEQAKVDLAAVEAEVVQEHERLNALMGLWGEHTQWRIEALLPSLPKEGPGSEGLEGRAIERSLDLGIARREMEIAARELGIARPLGWLNGADVGVAAERELDGAWSVGPSLSLPIPLFDQGQGAVGSAQARLRQASERFAASAIEIRSRVRASHAATTAARSRAAYYKEVILPLRQTIVDETQLQYNGMQVSAFQLLQAKRDQIEAGSDYILALRDYWLARSQLDQVLSGGSPEHSDKSANPSSVRRAGSREEGK